MDGVSLLEEDSEDTLSTDERSSDVLLDEVSVLEDTAEDTLSDETGVPEELEASDEVTVSDELVG